ncbi:hypothetical protein [Tabrizicola sp.]|uniref:hypothetical protein n=1 Tax=Tabrizicola sp. TaxID=2005166 RepID=UPI0035B47172
MSGKIVCVADTGEQFQDQVERWFACLTRLAGVAPRDLITVFANTSSPPDWAASLLRAGMGIDFVDAFDPRSPHCNKISGLLKVIGTGAGPIVLTDCDLAFLRDPRSFPGRSSAVSGKPVDFPNPPLRILDAILKEAGLPAQRKVRLSGRPWERTYLGNFNGGMIVFGRSIASRLVHRWAERAKWLLDRSALLEGWAVHVDQVSLFLAIIDEKIEMVPISSRFNYPTQARGSLFPVTPAALHYHHAVDALGDLKPTGSRAIDAQISLVNRTMSETRAAEGKAH